MKLLRFIAAALLAAALFFPALGCGENGPAEKAGKKLDKAVEQTKEKAGEMWEDAKDKAKDLSE